MEKRFILISVAVLFAVTLFAQTLTVNVKNIQRQGTLLIGLYNQSENFGNQKHTFENQKIFASSNSAQAIFENLPKGNYAVAIFQDLNKNGKLDKNFFGKPTEPYAFSNNVKPVFSAPTFDDCKFSTNGNETIEIKLINP